MRTPRQHPLQMISLRSSSWSCCCCRRSHAETASDLGTSAWCGCRWPTGASQGRCEVIQRALACRILGSTCLVQGNLIEARSLLEQALDNCLPDRDPSARFRFGHDPGAAAAAYLAIAAWHLGEVERARRLAEQAVETAAELGHVPTSANAYTYKLLLETRRDDPAAALRSAQMLIALAACRTRVCG